MLNAPRSLVLLTAAIAAPACLPYSAAVGQPATSVRTGGTEVGATIGIGHQRITPDREFGPDETTSMTQTPRLEGNILYGISDTLGLNVHVSDAGLQPGVKIVVVPEGNIHIAILPAFAFGRFGTTQEDTDRPDDDSAMTSLMLGARAIVSAPDSVYGAIGYDFQRVSNSGDGDVGDDATFKIHNLSLAIGIDLPFGGARIRPELALLYAGKATVEDDDAAQDFDRLVVFPSLTIAVATP
jgi:hypothetical protein